jgi:hypothetical protein
VPHNPYACPGCSGYRVIECYACGQETECDECRGSGLDSSRIDVNAFQAAAEVLQDEEGCTWSWVEGGVVLGRRNKARTLAYADFLRPGKE